MRLLLILSWILNLLFLLKNEIISNEITVISSNHIIIIPNI